MRLDDDRKSRIKRLLIRSESYRRAIVANRKEKERESLSLRRDDNENEIRHAIRTSDDSFVDRANPRGTDICRNYANKRTVTRCN